MAKPWKETLEVYSSQTNAAVIRYSGRKFPGILIQGDSLSSLCRLADEACRSVGRGQSGFEELNELRNMLQGDLAHYKATLLEHNMELPFSG